MLYRIKWLIFLSVCFFCNSFIPADHIYSVKKGSIVFRSEAISELIQASSNALKGKINIEKKMFAFAVSTKTFSGFNSPLQEEHYTENYLESNKFPDATFSGKIIEDIDFTKDGNYTVRAKGILNIHGQPKERILKCEITLKNGIIHVQSNFTVLLSEHNIPIPKVVHEKLASEIKVEVKAELTIQ